MGSSGDDRLAELIAAGLAQRVEGPVDVDGLLDGARVGARRIRRRRRVASVVAAVAVVVAIPAVAVGTGWPGGKAGSGFAQGPPGTAGPAVPGAPSGTANSGPGPEVGATPGLSAPAGSQVSDPTGAVLGRDAAGRIVLGDDAVLQESDVTVAVVSRSEDVTLPAGAGPTATALCSTLPAASARAAGGRSVGFSSAGSSSAGSSSADATSWQVRTVVRVLPGTAAADEMTWLRRSVGDCPGQLRLRRAAVAGVPGDGVVLGYQVNAPARPSGDVLVIGVVQQGRATASVELVVPRAAAAALASRVQLGLDQVRHLLALADRRLGSSGLVRQAGADPLLAS